MEHSAILWLDNDPIYTKAWRNALRGEDFTVDQAHTLSTGEEKLCHEDTKYIMMILDVMIPTTSKAEAERYPQSQTENGMKSGLFFYKRFKTYLEENSIPVLVMTNRMDGKTLHEFENAGLPTDHYETKYALRDLDVFVDRVKRIAGIP